MAKRFIAPALADLRQDIAGAIPLNLIQAWTASPQDEGAEREILSAFRRVGTVVSTDSAGLSKLSQERPLLEVMKMVSEPKEIVHAYGTAIGGNAVGIWTADNMEMFYPGEIHPREILDHMIAAQREIAPLAVHIGMGVHAGEFLEIGGGVFGPEADVVEALAEEFTEGGEIAVTPQVREKVQAFFPSGTFSSKGVAHMEAYRCDYRGVAPRALKGSNHKYPFPFNEEFFNFLRRYEGPDTAETQRILSSYGQEAVVILVRVRHPAAMLLRQLTQWVIANGLIQEVARGDQVTIIKSNGSLGIFLASRPLHALEFAEDMAVSLEANGFDYNIGIAGGEVLVFPMGNSEREIAGEPVNIASKISEDVEDRGTIYIEDGVAKTIQLLERVAGAERFRLAISHMELEGVKVKGTRF